MNKTKTDIHIEFVDVGNETFGVCEGHFLWFAISTALQGPTKRFEIFTN
jgi:hypothetical protein